MHLSHVVVTFNVDVFQFFIESFSDFFIFSPVGRFFSDVVLNMAGNPNFELSPFRILAGPYLESLRLF